MADEFENVREEVRHLQQRLRRMEDVFHQIQRQTITEFGYMPMHGHYHAIQQVEREIIELRQQMPPYMVMREGYYERLPVMDRINPREVV